MNNEQGIGHEQLLHNLIVEDRLTDTFLNVEIALRMYLVRMMFNSSSERSFTKFKLMNNRLRTPMIQERLSALSLLILESDILREYSLSDINKI